MMLLPGKVPLAKKILQSANCRRVSAVKIFIGISQAKGFYLDWCNASFC